MTEHSRLTKLLRKYLYEAQCKAAAHAEAESYNRRINKTTSASQMITSLAVGVLGVAAYNNVDECGSSTNIGLIATSVGLSFAASAVGVFRSIWRFASKEANHHTTSGNFADIASDIVLFFASNTDDVELSHFVEMTHERLDIYNASAASIANKYIDCAKARIEFPKNGNGGNGSLGSVAQHRTMVIRSRRDSSSVELQSEG